MTATNINVDQFLQVLSEIKLKGHQLVDIDFVLDEDSRNMKLVIHPVNYQQRASQAGQPRPQTKTEIRNPDISTENNDIFDYFGL